MRTKLFLLIVALSVCLTARAQTINENGIQVILNEKTAKVVLPVDSPADQTRARIRVELIDPAGDVKASAEESRTLIRGTNFVEIPIDITSALTNKDFRFYRLRYEIAGKMGILSLARATPDLFDLETFSFNFPQSRSRYMVRVRAIHPVTMKGVGNVRLEGKLDLEFNNSEEKTVDVQTRTDSDGFAELTFSLPEYAKLDDLDLKIKGTKNGFVNEVEPELPEHAFTHYSYIYFQTDKPIYQPGQVLRVRSLLFSDKKKAIADDPLTFTIKDGEGTVMSKIEATTSRFGIASLEWQIPESVKLGKYTVTVSGDRQLQNDVKTFTISRYDLPNFAVSAKPTRKYYLADQQTASVSVGADYLFGKPVTSAKVRVVEETERNWNWKLQKYEMKEGQVREGVLDATGKFTAEFDLADAHRSFGPYYSKFRDLTFAAYVTDLTTNKTEQRRFDIRITKEPIHLYLSKDADENGQMSRGLPGRFYLTAFYADGAPAECDFSIHDQQADGSGKDDPETAGLLARGRTNNLGAARVVMPLGSISPNNYYASLMIKARDRGGNKGTQMEQIRFDKLKPAAQVSTDKIVYGKGEPIKVDVLSSDRNGTLFLSVMQNAEVLVNEKLRMRGGKAAITIPYREGMKGPLTISAYGSYRSYWGAAQSFGGTRTVLYPSPGGMTLTARASKGTYRPGEEATIELATQMTGGGAEESAFGISVIDKAIDERARTDADFGAGYSSFYQDFLELLNVAPGPDPSKPISPEEELAIEIALKRTFIPNLQNSGNYSYEHTATFNRAFEKQFRDVSDSIQKRQFVELLPTDEASLRSVLAMDEVDVDKMLDPWGNRFRVSVRTTGQTSMLTFMSAGPDEIDDTADDITALTRHYNYFYGMGMKIRSTFGEYERRVEGIIQNYETLRDELKRQNIDLDALRDAWGRPYRFKFGFEGTAYRLHIESGGQDRNFGGYDDFTVWTHYLDYFAVTRTRMAAGIRDYLSKNGNFPADETEFRSVLKRQGFDLDELKDVFGRRYYLMSERRWRSGERRTIGSEKTKIIPISQDLVIYTLKSVGNDGKQGTPDDFELTRFVGIVPEKKAEADKDKRAKVLPTNSLLGVVTGTVADSNGAVVPGSTVTAKSVSTGREHTRTTDEEGRFIIDDLPAGTYEIAVTAAGFKTMTIQGVVIDSQTLTEINGMLEVGSVSEVVTVTAGAEIDQSSSTMGSNISTEFFSNLPINGRNLQGLYTIAPGVARSGLRDASGGDRDPSVAGSSGPENNYILDGVNESGQAGGVNRSGKTREQIETPRLREYFPEALLWLPELISSLDGKASFKFKLADSLTTWKVAVIGSTANGDIAIAEKEIRTFQPFFVDLDPPKFLTNGDEIFLPVQVRNYMATKQKVNVKMTKADWFSFLGADASQVDVEPSNSNNAVFGFKAGSVVKDGKQRVTAIAEDDSDAIEKPVTVRPDGEEIVKTRSQLFSGTAVFDVDYPANALLKSQKAELKVYPNLLSHVAESVEGLLRRPYGCGEQTISSTYPNLMILKFVKEGSTLRRTAKTYLKKGYERLTGYQVESGGFSYWGGKEAADVALTAYALRFLNDAKAFIDVDPEIVKKAHDWLVKQQRSDGSWTRQYYYENAEVSARTKMFTVYVARSLAMTGDKNDPVLARAFGYLKTRGRDADEPYTLALFGLASLDAGAPDAARSAAQRLEDMAIAEDGGVYWKLETDTPFYGSGTAGRLETTALVLQLLLKDAKTGAENAERKALIGKATLYLLKNKDRYGVWYSTQTTINVLDAFLAALSSEAADTADTIQISVNGKELPPVPIASDRVEPLIIDLTDRLDPAANKVEVKGSGFASLMAQIVAIHYVDWRDSESAKRSGAVHLNYKCDKTTTAIMQDVTCSVEAGKNASYGYGMLLAEIGTPPGADVSRESLQAAMDTDGAISRYDILPDRIVVYMWARPGGVKFNFKFRPRYGINAQTPASTIYDYYNPDAKATVVPMRFVVGN